MKSLKKILLVITIVFAVVVVNGILYVSFGQAESSKKLKAGKELNLYECCSIYSIHTAAWMFSWILSPEAALQCFMMAFGKEGEYYVSPFRSNFLTSDLINKLYLNYTKPVVINYPLNEITGNKKSKLRKELRWALAFDGAKFIEYGYGQYGGCIDCEAKYDKYIGVYSIGPITINFHWDLLNYIQEKGWIHKVNITYHCK